jgi:hypothetical protein
MTGSFLISLDKIQPSQLYISREKLSKVLTAFRTGDTNSLEPIPIKELNGEIVSTDGHTRGLAWYLNGFSLVEVECARAGVGTTLYIPLVFHYEPCNLSYPTITEPFNESGRGILWVLTFVLLYFQKNAPSVMDHSTRTFNALMDADTGDTSTGSGFGINAHA